MSERRMSKRWSARLAYGFVAMSAAVALAACGAPGASSPGGAASEGGGSATAGGAPYKVGLVYSKTGALAAYGARSQASFKVGLDYATKGTARSTADPIEVTTADDGGDPAKAATAATTTIGPALPDPGRLDRRPGSPFRSLRWRGERCPLHLRPSRADALTGSTSTRSARAGRPTRTSQTAGSWLANLTARRSPSSPRTVPSARPTSPAVDGGARRAGRDRQTGPGALRPATDLIPFATQAAGAQRRTCCSSPGPVRTPPRCGDPR